LACWSPNRMTAAKTCRRSSSRPARASKLNESSSDDKGRTANAPACRMRTPVHRRRVSSESPTAFIGTIA
jgi:hypothetical protein